MELDVKITDAMLASSRKLRHASDVIFSRFAMTATSREILRAIETGVSTTTALAEIMGSTPAGITHNTKALEQAGYIERSFDKADKRIWHFKATADGNTALADVEAIYQQALKQLYSGFSDAQRRQALDFLDRVQTHLDTVLHGRKADFIQFVDHQITQRGAG